jgi:hypothetical protein
MEGHRLGACVALIVLSSGCTGDAEPAAEPPKVDQGHPPAANPPANIVGGFSIQLPEETLQPGDETFPCWIFPLTIEGPSRIVGGAKLVTGPGMHHGNITTRPKGDGEGIRPCGMGSNEFGSEAMDIVEGGSVLFGSTTQIEGEEWQSLPDGMGYEVDETYEIVARMHYLNASPEPVTVSPTYEWFTIDEAKVTERLGPFAWKMSGWEIPPLSTLTVSSICRPDAPMNIVNALPHMHGLGIEFFGRFIGGPYDGQRWLDSRGYDPESTVVTQYTPAMDISQGEAIEWGCTWTNTFDKTIVEGTGDNEMCILYGYAYPYEQAFSALSVPGDHCAMTAPPPPGSGG